jgi:hypothetical protein
MVMGARKRAIVRMMRVLGWRMIIATAMDISIAGVVDMIRRSCGRWFGFRS